MRAGLGPMAHSSDITIARSKGRNGMLCMQNYGHEWRTPTPGVTNDEDLKLSILTDIESICISGVIGLIGCTPYVAVECRRAELNLS